MTVTECLWKSTLSILINLLIAGLYFQVGQVSITSKTIVLLEEFKPMKYQASLSVRASTLIYSQLCVRGIHWE